MAVCKWLTRTVGVAAIPPSPFYSPAHQHLTDQIARFTFCKTDDMLDEAVRRTQRDTRRFARKQRTWHNTLAWPLGGDDPEAAVEAVAAADKAVADWPHWRGGEGGMGYSPLAQIAPDNVRRLRAYCGSS